MKTASPPKGATAPCVSRRISRSAESRALIPRETVCPPHVIPSHCCLKSLAAVPTVDFGIQVYPDSASWMGWPRRGIVFANYFCTAAVCQTSRAGMLTRLCGSSQVSFRQTRVTPTGGSCQGRTDAGQGQGEPTLATAIPDVQGVCARLISVCNDGGARASYMSRAALAPPRAPLHPHRLKESVFSSWNQVKRAEIFSATFITAKYVLMQPSPSSSAIAAFSHQRLR